MYRCKQQGAALIILVVLMVLTAATLYITNYSVDRSRLIRQSSTASSLIKAKEALLSYAAIFYESQNNRIGIYGLLPCPETRSSTGEGLSAMNCGNRYANTIGRLPWNNLDIPPVKDGAGECLWYAVTGGFKNQVGTNRNSLMHNEDSLGMFELFDENGNLIKGSVPEDRVVAVIIAPGTALTSQRRPRQTSDPFCRQTFIRANNNIDEYLEDINGIDNSDVNIQADQIDQFATLTSAKELDDFNDRIITITQREIFNAINRHIVANAPPPPAVRQGLFSARMNILTEALALCVRANMVGFGPNASLPWAAPLALGADYRISASYTDNIGRLNFGRYPFDITNFNPIPPDIFTACNAITLQANLNTLDPVNNHPVINLSNPADEYRILWGNWKDHFFYAVSNDFNGAGNGDCSVPGSCYNNTGDTIRYHAMVIFSDAALNAGVFNQRRRSTPPEPNGSFGPLDSKDDPDNYLETIPNIAGSGVYTLDPNGNDIMYCLVNPVPAPGVQVCQ